MRKNLDKELAVFPMPVLMVAAYNDDGSVNVMNAAWGQICSMQKIALFIDEDHKTTQDILKRRAFTVSLADVDHLAEADFFGIATGNKMPDKFERSGLTAVKSDRVDAPVINEFPVCMECELDEIIDHGDVYAVIGRIVGTTVDERVLDEKGIDPEKIGAVMFDQFRSGYYALGERVGRAWNAGKDLMKK